MRPTTVCVFLTWHAFVTFIGGTTGLRKRVTEVDEGKNCLEGINRKCLRHVWPHRGRYEQGVFKHESNRVCDADVAAETFWEGGIPFFQGAMLFWIYILSASAWPAALWPRPQYWHTIFFHLKRGQFILKYIFENRQPWVFDSVMGMTSPLCLHIGSFSCVSAVSDSTSWIPWAFADWERLKPSWLYLCSYLHLII